MNLVTQNYTVSQKHINFETVQLDIIRTDCDNWVSSFLMARQHILAYIHIDSCWKIQDRRQNRNTDNTQTKHYPEKQTTQNTAKKTNLV